MKLHGMLVRRWAPLAMAGALMSAPSSAAARGKKKGGDDEGPWRKGLIVPSLVLGGTFSAGGGSLFSGALAFGGGVKYFVTNGLGVGLSFNNDIRFFSPEAKSDFPGIEDELPTYTGRLIPDLTFVIYRSPRFSPYLSGGVGPVFLNNGGGVLAEWSVGVGALIGLGRAVAIDLGLGASQIFPEDKCAEAWSFTASNGSSVDGRANCNVYFFPRVGLVFSIPTRSAKRARRSKEREPSKERESTREQIREEPRPAPDRSSGWAVPGAASAPGAGPEPAAPLSEDAAAPAATETPAAAPSDAGDEAVEASSPAAEASSPEPAAEPAPEPAPGTR